MLLEHGASNSIKSLLVRTKPDVVFSDTSGAGVYGVGCDRCYVGETGRCFSVRLREHRDAVRLGKVNNAVFNHVSDTHHRIDWSKSKIVFHSDNLYTRQVIESALINETTNFNNKPGVSSVDYLSRDIILNSNPRIRKNFAKIKV